MTDFLRWGILGAANFAKQHMAPAIRAARFGDLVALATSSEEKARAFTESAPNLRVHYNYDDLLNDPGVDAVYIPLPNHLHVEWAKKALLAGKHVLCEKPIAMHADEIDALITLRDQTGLLAAEAYMIVHHPQWQRAREIVQGGDLGPLIMVDGVFSYDNRSDGGNIRNRRETGGGGIPDIGVYTYGSARYVTSEEPEEILSAHIRWEKGVDVWAHVCARFPGFHYSAVNSMRMPARQEMNFHGEKAMLRLTAPFNPGVFGEAQLELHQPDQSVTTWRFPRDNHYVLQVEAFNLSVLNGTAYPCPLEFSQGTQRMIDRVFETADPPGQA